MPRRTLALEWRVSLFAGALAALSSASVAYVAYSVSHDELVRREEAELVDHAQVKLVALRATLDELSRDALYLAGTPPIADLARAAAAGGTDPETGESWDEIRARLATLFAQMLRTGPEYTHARLIGVADGGREIVRVDRAAGRARPTASSELQRKGQHRYFREGVSRAVGEVFLSDFELNREHGAISLPHQPVVRAVTPVLAPDGTPFGVIVLNLDLHVSFGKLQDTSGARRLYVVNERGDFLVHPDRDKTFRFELGEPYRVSDEFPSLVPAFDTGAAWATVVERSGVEPWTLGMIRGGFDPLLAERRLGVIVAEPRAQVVAASDAARTRSIEAAVLLILLTVGVVFTLTRRLTRQIGGEPAEIEAITRRVADGELDLPVGDRPNAQGILGSVQRMVVALREAQVTGERNDWLNLEVAAVLEETQRAPSLDALARSVISRLARATRAAQGAFYVCRNGADGPELRRLGSFALDERRSASDRIRFGDGLIGQCALERQTLVYYDLPPESARLQSGLVSGLPLNLIVVPVCLDREVVAAFELASFSHFDEGRRQLLERVCPNLAVAIDALLSRERTEQLLAETRELSAESQAQAEELRVANEDLEETSRALARQTEELETQSEELRETNKQLEATQDTLRRKAVELQRASAYKSQFLANVSHELRTPLNSMLLLARSLGENASGNLTSDQVEEIGVIERGGRDLLHLINGILDLSRIEAGRVDLDVRPVSLRPLLAGLDAQFRPLADDRGLELAIECAEELPEALATDEFRLTQILRNLLANAIKFTDQGSVRVRASYGADPALPVAFEVRDTGIGIPRDRQAVVFEGFTQVDETRSARFGGSGLGLSIAQQLARLLGGEIRLESEPGVGSVFTLLLPNGAARERVATSEAVSHTNATGAHTASTGSSLDASRSVLIVEDDLELAHTLAAIVRERGYEPHVFPDAASVLTSAARLRPCAILLDLGLPDLDGVEVLRRLKEDPLTAKVPVHVVTGRDGSEALACGAAQVLAKPVSRESLERILSTQTPLRRILIADANARERGSLRAALARDGVVVVEADASEPTIERLREDDFDCVIVDRELCDPELTRALIARRERSHGEEPGIFVQTSGPISDAEERKLREFASALVVKGGGNDRLVDEVSMFLHSVEAALPAEQRRAVSMLSRNEAGLAGKRVLIVDDDIRNTFALSRALRGKGMEVVIADDGQLALDRLRDSGPFDAVLMDMMMPTMDGYAATRAIRARPELAEVPVIALTARAMTGDRDRCLEAGANDYLTKPIDLDRLLAILRVWLVERV